MVSKSTMPKTLSHHLMEITSQKEEELEKEGNYLYHYTTQAGAHGILESGTVWASDPRFLNDAVEVEIGRNICLEAIEQLQKNPPDSRVLEASEVEGALSNLAERFEYHSKEYLRPGFFCVTYFSMADDDLNQWRGYGSRNSVMLAFHKNVLDNAILHCTTNMRDDIYLSPVLYVGEKDKERYIQFTRAQINNGLVGHSIGDGKYGVSCVSEEQDARSREEKLSELVDDLSNSLWRLIPYLKDKSFESEKEWRLLVRGAKVEWRPGSSYLIPYTKVQFHPVSKTKYQDINKKKYESVWTRLGPGSSPLARYYYEERTQHVEMRKIPYRTG